MTKITYTSIIFMYLESSGAYVLGTDSNSVITKYTDFFEISNLFSYFDYF